MVVTQQRIPFGEDHLDSVDHEEAVMFALRSRETEDLEQEAPTGSGPVMVPEGLRWCETTAYTAARGEYLGFGADFGACEVAPSAVDHE